MKTDFVSGDDRDVTPIACRESPPGAPSDCEQSSNSAICAAFGGTCMPDGSCVDESVGDGTDPGSVIGTCSATGSFNPSFSTPCGGGSVPVITYPRCVPKGEGCTSNADCCGGTCAGALDAWSLMESGGSQVMVCKDVDEYAWLIMNGDPSLGGDSIVVSGAASCTTAECARSFSPGTSVTMSLASGKSANWYGCDASSATSCTVSVSKTRNVQVARACTTAICTNGGACAAGSGSPGEMGSGCTLKGSYPSFSDATATDVVDAAYLGWMSPCGYESWGAPKFCPNDSVSRGEMATILVRALFGDAFPLVQPTTPYFSDVAPTDWRFKYVQKLYEIGLTHGYSGLGGAFGPNDLMTREQMAAFLVRLWAYRNYGSAESFTACSAPFFDDEPQPAGWSPYSSTHTMFDYVQKLRELGITVGVSVDPPLFSPATYVTRSQMASFVMRELGPSALPGYVSGTSPASCMSSHQIVVTSATYGGDCGAPAGNVTAPVATACDRQSGACAYPVSVSTLGDPAPGCYKTFTVDYRCGATQHATVSLGGWGWDANGQTAMLTCP